MLLLDPTYGTSAPPCGLRAECDFVKDATSKCPEMAPWDLEIENLNKNVGVHWELIFENVCKDQEGSLDSECLPAIIGRVDNIIAMSGIGDISSRIFHQGNMSINHTLPARVTRNCLNYSYAYLFTQPYNKEIWMTRNRQKKTSKEGRNLLCLHFKERIQFTYCADR